MIGLQQPLIAENRRDVPSLPRNSTSPHDRCSSAVVEWENTHLRSLQRAQSSHQKRCARRPRHLPRQQSRHDRHKRASGGFGLCCVHTLSSTGLPWRCLAGHEGLARIMRKVAERTGAAEAFNFRGSSNPATGKSRVVETAAAQAEEVFKATASCAARVAVTH